MTEIPMDSWHSYPSIFAMGHKHLTELLLDPVTVEEKIDGSQFSFGVFDDGLRCRSKGVQLNIFAPDKMFQRAVDVVRELPLHPGWTYRAEYLMRPHHNALAYNRIPSNHLIIFDINSGHETYLSWAEKAEEAARLGLECVPLIFAGVVGDIQMFRAMLDTMSVLGGQKIEGVVVKNYQRFGLDKKALMGKFVSEAFKEVHAHVWKQSNPTQNDILVMLGNKYNSQARWQKAVQHLRERGLIEDSPRDIGLLFKEIWPDIEKECADEIKDALYAWAVPHLRRLVTNGFPSWYKDVLLAKQFESPTI
jgi:RNA ligase